jgi:CSLREA domain-containing protein
MFLSPTKTMKPKHYRLFVLVVATIIITLGESWSPTAITAAPDSAFTVNSTTDAVDAIDDGICASSVGQCTLRAAIQEANRVSATSHTINIPAGNYIITLPGTEEDAANSGDLDIQTTMVLSGAGTESTFIDGNQLDRVFHVTPSGSVTFQNLTIRNGKAPAGETENDNGGGGIFIEGGPVTLQNAILENNQAVSNGENKSYGGAIETLGGLTIINTTLQFNSASHGGGIFSNVGTTVEIRNSLIYSNTATNTGGGLDNNGTAILKNITFSANSSPDGGGIYNGNSLDINHATIADNQSGISNSGVLLKIYNSILANNSGENCLSGNALTSQGHNTDSGTSCGFSDGINDEPTDQSNTNPRLQGLADNGGSSLTYALLAGSPAIDNADSETCLTTDQRSESRPVDGDGNGNAVCDIGAYESQRLYAIYLPLVLR